MFLLFPFFVKCPGDIWRILQHYLQMSRVHKRDKRFFDDMDERIAFEAVEGLLTYIGVESLDELYEVLREAMEQQYAQREKRRPTPQPSEGHPSCRKAKPPRAGYQFIWAPPDSWQCIFWSFSKVKRQILVRELHAIMCAVLRERFDDAPRLVTVHTDTARMHAEAAVSKYCGGKKLKGFKGINRYGDSDASVRGMLAALKGQKLPEDAINWIAHTSYKVTAALKEKTHLLYQSLDEDAQMELIGKAMRAHEWLSVLRTDETLDGQEEYQASLGELAIPRSQPALALAHEEIALWLGKSITVGILPDTDWMAPVQQRVEKVNKRREKEKQLDAPHLPGKGTRGRDRQIQAKRKKKREQELKDKREIPTQHPNLLEEKFNFGEEVDREKSRKIDRGPEI